jgi:hypothetical protein
MATTARAPRLVVGALAIAAALVVGGCTSDPDPSTKSDPSSGSGSSSTAPAQDTVRGAADKVLGFATAQPVTTQAGKVMAQGNREVPAKAEVLSLTRGKGSTVLLVRLTAQEEVNAAGGIFSNDEVGQSIDGVSIAVGDQKFYPGNYRYGEAVLAQNCTCTELIRQLGPEGVWLSAEFEAVPEGTSEVTLSIPGFTAASVPVTTKQQ